MTTPLLRASTWLAVAAGSLLAAPPLAPYDPTLSPTGEALAAGVVSGAALFLVLAGGWVPAGLGLVPRRRLAARSFLIIGKSTQEEAFWRALVLGALVAPIGRLGALALSTVLFACAHLPRQGRAAAAHLLSGLAFGAVYLATGRLIAAIAAHAAYNVLVGTSLLIRETLSVSDTSPRRAVAIASTSPSRRIEQMPVQSPPQTPPVARLERVVKSFGVTTALAGVDLELHRGEILALLGPNGAGKSTAVALLLGLRRPDAGSATLFGCDPRDVAARRHVGAVLQDIGYPPAIRVRELAELVGAHFPGSETPDAALHRLDLESLAGREAMGLSGGQKRRLAVALALVGRPEALFLDEPTAGMDASARRDLLADIRAFSESGGAVLLTTQQLAEAEEIASRVILLVGGRVAFEGTVGEMRSRAGLTRVKLRARDLPPVAGSAVVYSADGRHVLYVEDADGFVAELVRSGVPFSELEISPASLEDAFLALTEETGA